MSKQTFNSLTSCNCSDSTNYTTATSSILTGSVDTSNVLTYTNGGLWTTVGGYEYLGREIQLSEFIQYFKEDEIEEFLDKIIERSDENPKDIISSVVRARHFSEDFILKYMEYLKKTDLNYQHKHDILSRNYERLCLQLETMEN